MLQATKEIKVNQLQYGVYFIYCGDYKYSPVKIGVTSDLEEQVEELTQLNLMNGANLFQ